jgi:hypothetical protein
MRALMRGEWSTARPLIEHARGLARHCEPEIFNQLGGMNTALEFETAGANAEVLRLMELGGSGGAWSGYRLYVYQSLGRRELIEQEIDTEIERIRTSRAPARLWPSVALTDVVAYLGNAERASLVLEWLQGFEHLHVVGNVYGGPVSLGIGTLHKTLRDWPRAFDSLETALRMTQEVKAAPFECRARLHLASTHKRRRHRGDIETARHHATEALHLADKLEMPHQSRQARRMLASLGG